MPKALLKESKVGGFMLARMWMCNKVTVRQCGIGTEIDK